MEGTYLIGLNVVLRDRLQLRRRHRIQEAIQPKPQSVRGPPIGSQKMEEGEGTERSQDGHVESVDAVRDEALQVRFGDTTDGVDVGARAATRSTDRGDQSRLFEPRRTRAREGRGRRTRDKDALVFRQIPAKTERNEDTQRSSVRKAERDGQERTAMLTFHRRSRYPRRAVPHSSPLRTATTAQTCTPTPSSASPTSPPQLSPSVSSCNLRDIGAAKDERNGPGCSEERDSPLRYLRERGTEA